MVATGCPARYSKAGLKFDGNEKFYRLGFEAAIHAKYRNKEYDRILNEMEADIEEVQRHYPEADAEEPFRRGFERGRARYQEVCAKFHG